MTACMHPTSRSEVNDAATFGAYSQQTIGTAYITPAELVFLRTKLKEFFAQTPWATYQTLVQTVEYVRAKRIRLARPASVLPWVPYAFKDGFLPEMDPRNHAIEDSRVEHDISWILEREHDDWWVNALTFAVGVDNRRALVRSWKTQEALGA